MKGLHLCFAVMNLPFLTADWQFHSPPTTESSLDEDGWVDQVSQLASIIAYVSLTGFRSFEKIVICVNTPFNLCKKMSLVH